MQVRNFALIVLIACLAGCSYTTRAEGTTKHIILFIGDGMQLTNELVASRYLYGEDAAMSWHEFPYEGYMATWDIDTYNRYACRAGEPALSADTFDPQIGYDAYRGGVAPWPAVEIPDPGYFTNALPTIGGGDDTYAIPATDSASAATAMATGFKTDQGNVSWEAGDPADGQLTTIAELMRDTCGSAIGVVSTVEFSHPTPAAFVAHNVNRGNPGPIAHEIINVTKPEVVIGAGHPDWISGYISSSDYNAVRDSEEYVFVERESGVDGGDALLNAASSAVDEGRKLFGLFGGANGCFDHPEAHDDPGSPGFDRNEENPTLADATVAALTVLSGDPDGFFLMVEQGDLDWSNHYNNYHWMIGSMWDLEEAVKAAIAYVDRPGDSLDWSNTLMIVTSDHATGGLRFDDLSSLGIGDIPEMTGRRYHYEFPGGEVGYNATQHTNEVVMVYARGAGLEAFREYGNFWYEGTRIIDNTHLFLVMQQFAGI